MLYVEKLFMDTLLYTSLKVFVIIASDKYPATGRVLDSRGSRRTNKPARPAEIIYIKE